MSVNILDCIKVDDMKSVKSDRLPNFKIAEGVYAKFDLKGKQGDFTIYSLGLSRMASKSEYETTTKPSMQFIIN